MTEWGAVDDLYDNYLGNYYEAKLRPSEGYTAFREAKFAHNYLDLLAPHRAGTLLEIGPGMGEFLRFVTTKGNYTSARGVDYAPDCVEHCRGLGLDVEHISDLAPWLDQHQDEFAAIVMLHVLEHIPKTDTIDVLSTIRRSLKPGGVLIAEVPNAGNPWLSGIARYEDFTHQVGYTSGSLQFVMARAGFHDVSVRGVKVPWKSKYGPVRLASEVGNGITKVMTKLSAPRADHLLDAQIFAVATA